MVQKEMVWDLAQLVKSAEPASVKNEMETAVSDTEKFRQKYQGKITKLDAKGLLKMIEERDQLALKSEGAFIFAYESYQVDSTSSLNKTLYDSFRKNSSKVGQILAFMDVELGKLLAQKPSIINDPVLAEYKHKLERVIRRIPHMLSETEESLTIVKDTNGITAWQQLQGDWLSTRMFNIEVDGKMKTLPYGEIIGLYEHHDRDVRKRANQVVYENLGKDDIVWASAIRAICADHVEMCKLRKYPSPTTQSLIANDVDQKTIDSLIKTIETNVGIYRSYLKLKAKLLGLKKLANYDIDAPLPKVPEREFSWEDARRETIAAYASFDEQIGNWVKEMFDRYHIDGEVRKGKMSGAWCDHYFGGKTAFVVLSFNKKLGDVFKLAHENGHAVHAYLGSRAQKLSNYDIGSCIAECGSIFGELLLTERLLSTAKSKQEKQAVLAKVLDEFGMAAFQVSGRYFFEKSLYEAIERGEFLDGETVSKYWMAGRDKIYGDTVEWLDVMKWEWTMKPHYYMANYRFYNYPYVFAQVFVYALYRLYKEEGKAFVPKLKTLLSAGSSKSPLDLGKELGFDISSETFWQKGMDQAAEFVKMLEATQ
jgi:oligoendopeptidase F